MIGAAFACTLGRRSAVGGGGGASVFIPSGDYTATSLTTSVCNITFSSAGTYSITDDATSSGTWRLTGASADYDIRWTNTAGTLTTGTAGTWQNLATSRAFGVTRATFGTKTCTGTVEIRSATSLLVVATGTITLNATVDI